MSCQGIDEDTEILLTDQRGPNTLITCEMNPNEVLHWNNHYFKFQLSDLYINIQYHYQKMPKPGLHFPIVQNFKNSDAERSTWYMVNGCDLALDMTKRKDGCFDNIYDDICAGISADPVPIPHGPIYRKPDLYGFDRPGPAEDTRTPEEIAERRKAQEVRRSTQKEWL